MFGFSFSSLISAVVTSIIFGVVYSIAIRIAGDIRFMIVKLPLVLKLSILDKTRGISKFATTVSSRLYDKSEDFGEAVWVFLKIVCFAVFEILLLYFLLDGVFRCFLVVISIASYYAIHKLFCGGRVGKRRRFAEFALTVIAIILRVVFLPVLYLMNIIVAKLQKMYKMKSFCSTLSLDKSK